MSIFRTDRIPSLSRLPKEMGRGERPCERCGARTQHIWRGSQGGQGFKGEAPQADQLATIGSLVTMGPKTGVPGRRPILADSLVEQMYEKCPSGEITGVTSRRETVRAPFASVETIRIQGYCIAR